MNVRVATDGFEIPGEEGAHAVGGGLVVAGRFDLDELADGLDDFFLAGFEIEEALAPEWIGWFRSCFFSGGHVFLRRVLVRGLESSPEGDPSLRLKGGSARDDAF